MPDREPDLKLLSSKIYDFVCGLLEEEHEPAAICLGLTSHAAMLGTQTGADGKEIVANLFLPIVHQIMDNSNYLLDEEVEDENTGRITHKCATIQ